MTEKQVSFSGQVSLPAVGQGTWYMGEKSHHRRAEVNALCAGIDLGLTLIDTAEMYAEGAAEEVVGEALAGRRDKAFLVSKVYPWNAGGQKAITACEGSLRRLNTDYLDLYLLHWSGSYSFAETVAAMEKLIAQGKSAAGAFLISILMLCRNYGRSLAGSSAPLIRCCIIWPPVGLSMTCCPGVSSIRCR